MRPSRILSAMLLAVLVFAAASIVDGGLTRTWAAWARAVWVTALMLGVVGTVVLGATGLGLLSSETLQASYPATTPPNRRLDLRHFLVVYLGALVAGIGLALALETSLSVDPRRTTVLFSGALFALAATRRPWWLYDTVRRLGWFRDIQSDRAMQALLAVVGIGFLAAGTLL